MEVLLNELSLNGQFNSEDDFFDNVDEVLSIIKLIEVLDSTITKEYSFFNLQVTETLTFYDFLKLRTDRARKMKSFFMKLAHNPPFWNTNQIHNCEVDSYEYKSKEICGSSLAESYERDRCVLSFSHPMFTSDNLHVYKNTTLGCIDNIIEKKLFLDKLLQSNEITLAQYCNHRFKNTNLNFSNYEEDYGFSSLDTSKQVETFINAFNEFSLMSWDNIMSSDGLEYKKYNKPSKKKKGWFRDGTYRNTDIYKFRVTQEYRCFGYRIGDEFFVLRFEIDHSISDNG